MKFTRIFSILLLTSLFFMCSCGCSNKNSVEAENASPVLKSISPADGATNIEGSSISIIFTYDQNVKVPAGAQAGVTVDNGAVVSKVFAPGKSVDVTLDGLTGGKKYTVSIAKETVFGFKTNQPAAEAVTMSFTTKEAEIAEPVDDGNPAWQRMKELGLGWNIGNQMDAMTDNVANETCWGNPAATQQTFDKVKSYGYKSVRVPITWSGHIGAAPDYKIDEAWLNRVAEIVGYAEKAGLHCIINTHHDEEGSTGNWLSVKKASTSVADKEEITAKFKALWTQVATRFKDKGDFLMFEPFNELQDGGWGWSEAFKKNPKVQTDILNEWNQVFVDAVRATGGNNANRWLCVAGYAASSTITHQYLKLPEDSADGRLMVGFHSYDPYDYCLSKKYPQWGHTRKTDTGNALLSEEALLGIFKPYYQKYVSKGIAVYIGEFGCVNRTNAKEQAFQKYYLEYFCKAARTYGMSAFLWDNGVGASDSGEALGYIHHGNGSFLAQGEELTKLMVKAMTDNDSNYTLDYVYKNSAPKQ